MLRRWWNWKSSSVLGVAFLGLHGLYLVLLVSRYPLCSNFFMCAAPLAAVAACCAQIRLAPARARSGWVLFSAALVVWSLGMSLATADLFSKPVGQEVAALYDLLYFLYGVPILLVISSPVQSSPVQGERVSVFLWLDGLQAAITLCLVYVLLFARLPFTAGRLHALSALDLMWVFNIENLVLALGITVRLLSYRQKGSLQHLYRVMAGFLWIYCVCAGAWNYLVVSATKASNFSDLLPDLPFVFLVVAVSLPSGKDTSEDERLEESPVALFLDNVSPVLYTIALLALGAVVVRTHFRLGMGSIGVALSVYALRTTLLQNRYMRSQRALKEAHDRLEEIALEDALTRVANRRRFDQSLREEWNRALRLEQPLSLLMVDVDYFKRFNDREGHLAGDRCLVEVAGGLQSAVARSGDLLARYGGEEFAAILVNTDRDGARVIAARMQEAVRALRIPNASEAGDFVSISVGVATWTRGNRDCGEESLQSLVEASDRALYRAKQNGRNRVEFASAELLAG